MISNWDFSLVLAISELLVDPQQPSSLLDIKLHAFQKAKDLMLQYESAASAEIFSMSFWIRSSS